MSTKKVIFIGGSSYSGSTLLDMMLASGSEGFSLGEVSNLFYPTWKHHLQPSCGCGNEQCPIWPMVKEKGKNTVYQNIFGTNPKKTFVVDSSKVPFWIWSQSKKAAAIGYDIKHVLIWKSPLEYAKSRFKRGNIKGWANAWKSYYRIYISTIDQWVSVNYADIVANPQKTLSSLCEAINVDYFDGKEKYWDAHHHTIFGNNSAKVHLYDKNSESYNSCRQWIKERNKKEKTTDWMDDSHKSIYSQPTAQISLPPEVIEEEKNDKEIHSIIELLNSTSHKTINKKNNRQHIKENLEYSTGFTRLWLWRWWLKSIIRKHHKLQEQIK